MAEDDIKSICSDTEPVPYTGLDKNAANNAVWRLLDELEAVARRTANCSICTNIRFVLYTMSVDLPRLTSYPLDIPTQQAISDQNAMAEIARVRRELRLISDECIDYEQKYKITRNLRFVNGKTLA